MRCMHQNTAGQSLWRFLIDRDIQRNRRAADCMPGSDPADESPGVIARLSQVGHGPTIDLKSADEIDPDRTASRQLLDPARKCDRGVHGGPRQHIGAPGKVYRQARHPMTNFRRPRSAPPATGRSGTGRKAGMALRSSRAAPSRWKPAAAYPAILTACNSPEESLSNALLPTSSQSPVGPLGLRFGRT